MIYTIVDIETIGRGHKITEISIFKFDGEQVIDEFTSLVNPQTTIPPYITALTGIDNSMLVDAPLFSDIAQDILKITEDTTFVAHNVNFDYNIIRNEFKAIQINFTRRKLCTVRLSRKLLPGYKSYSLGKLCSALKIKILNRHRARGDAEATVILFKMLLQQDNAASVCSHFLNKNSKEATLPAHLSTATFNTIPNTAGIYYFKNKKGKVIYVGKAKNLKKRVLSHFYSKKEKELELSRETADIDFEVSGSELVALLMEDAAIKHYYPQYNKASKRPTRSYAIFSYVDRQGIIHLAYNILKHAHLPLLTFQSIQDCRGYLERLCAKFELCPKYCHLQEHVSSCSHYNIDMCWGVCNATEDINTYNLRVQKATDFIIKSATDIILKENGRTPDEEAFVMVKNGRYLGYGFIDKTQQISNLEDLEHFLIKQKDNNDTQRILRRRLVDGKIMSI